MELEETVALHVEQGVVRKEKFEIIIHATISVVSLCWSFSKECKPLLLLLVKKPEGKPGALQPRNNEINLNPCQSKEGRPHCVNFKGRSR